jgi:predicted N-acetyltransferase YhbS
MEIRTAKPEEVKQIVDLANYVFRTSKNLEPSMGRQFPMFLSPENASNLYVAVDNGKVVSHMGIKKETAMINGHKLSMAGMGSVCTHPDYQGQGLATKLLHQVFHSLNEQGVAVLKISGSRGLYKTNGCMQIESIVSYSFDIESYPEIVESGIQFTYIDNPQDTSVLADIYHKEPVRYQRARWEFPILFHAMPTVHPPAGRIYTAVVAKLSQAVETGIAYTIGYEREPGIYEIIEYAGQRRAIPAMIRYLFKEKNMKQVHIQYAAYDKELTEIFNSILPEKQETYLSPMTVKIINKDVLWNQISPIIAEQWPDKYPPQLIQDLEKIVGEQDDNITRFLFDDYERPAYGNPWDTVLPIPLPWYGGLNYV